MKRAGRRVATVWVFFQDAKDAGLDIDQEWAKRGTFDFVSFNPVELTIRPEDVPAAEAKWATICGEPNRTRVVYRDWRVGDRYNRVYDAPVVGR